MKTINLAQNSRMDPEQIFLLDKVRQSTRWWPYRTYKSSLKNIKIKAGHKLAGENQFVEVTTDYVPERSTVQSIIGEVKKKAGARPAEAGKSAFREIEGEKPHERYLRLKNFELAQSQQRK